MRQHTWHSLIHVALATLLLMTACTREVPNSAQQQPVEQQDVIATVDGAPITRAAFSRELARRSGKRSTTKQDKAAVLEEMLQFEALVARARQAGYDQDPDIVAHLKRLMVNKFRQDQLDSRMAGLTVSAAEIERHYRAHIAHYTTPEMARAALITFTFAAHASADERAALRARAAAVRAEALAQDAAFPTFGALARTYSDDRSSKYVGGDMGWLAKGSTHYKWEPAVIDAVFALAQPGAVSPVIETDGALYLVKLAAKKPPVIRPLEQVQANIRQQIMTEKKRNVRDAWQAEMRANTRIDINHALLETTPTPLPANGERQRAIPPALPAG